MHVSSLVCISDILFSDSLVTWKWKPRRYGLLKGHDLWESSTASVLIDPLSSHIRKKAIVIVPSETVPDDKQIFNDPLGKIIQIVSFRSVLQYQIIGIKNYNNRY